MMIIDDNNNPVSTAWNTPMYAEKKPASHRSSVRGWLSCMRKEEWEKFLRDTKINENEENTETSVHKKIIAWVVTTNS